VPLKTLRVLLGTLRVFLRTLSITLKTLRVLLRTLRLTVKTPRAAKINPQAPNIWDGGSTNIYSIYCSSTPSEAHLPRIARIYCSLRPHLPAIVLLCCCWGLQTPHTSYIPPVPPIYTFNLNFFYIQVNQYNETER
jgi:hypothetical protein